MPAARRAVLLAVLLVAFGLVLLAVETHWSPVLRLDRHVAGSLHRSALEDPGAVSWWLWVSRVLHPNVERVAYAIAVVALLVARRVRTAIVAVVAMVGEAVLDSVVKLAVGRPRPAFAHPVATAAGASFPSGHALGATVAFGLLVLLVPRGYRTAAAVLAVVAVGLVSFSRLALGVHYLTDVVGGWLLGAAWLTAVAWVADVRGLLSPRKPPAAGPPAADPPRRTPAC